MKDKYFCLNCNHKGEVDGIISLLTPCERCNSLLIMPVASMHMFEIDTLIGSMPNLVAEESQYRKWRGKRHLRVVPDEADTQQPVTKNGTPGQTNET